MTVLWTAYEAAIATGGYITTDSWEATGIAIDSRSVVKGDLFVALCGVHDGHDFVATALEHGAKAAVVTYPPPGVDQSFLLVRGNTDLALRALAHRARSRSSAVVVAITGSVGKTGTKEMLKRVLSEQGTVHATEGNFNNCYGVPLTLARMPATVAFTLLEIGINHPGELLSLSHLASPDVVVITAVEEAHLEFFSSVTAISDAKGEIFSGMNKQGVAILNRDCISFERLAYQALSYGISNVYGFGAHRMAEFRLCDYSIVGDSTLVSAQVFGKPLTYKIGTCGYHWAVNSLSIVATVLVVGGCIQQAIDVLSRPFNLSGRGIRKRLILEHGDIEIIDDSYNANPASVKAALAVLGASSPTSLYGRRIAVLGDMLELGPEGWMLHASLSEVILEQKIDLVFTVGSLMAHLYMALPPEQRGSCVSDAVDLADIIKTVIRPGDVVLVKGSAATRVSIVVAAMQRMTMLGVLH